MRVNRENLLGAVQSIAPGLASREVSEQSSCVVFHKGKVCSFNEEIFCSNKSPLGSEIEGAIPARHFMELLSKLKEDELEIEQAEGELLIRGKGKKSSIRMEAEVLLKIDAVETPEEWNELDKEFSEAANLVHACTSTDTSQFVLTCVHVTPKFLEACDRNQLARFPLNIPISRPTLIRGPTLAKVPPCGMTEISETPSWLHFRNQSGLVLSCRRFLDDYKDLSQFLSVEDTTKFPLPGGLEETVKNCEIFSGENSTGNNVWVDLNREYMGIRGEGPSGWHEERKKVVYAGPPMQFMIAPKLLVEISKKSKECSVRTGRLMVDTGKFIYATCTTVPDTK